MNDIEYRTIERFPGYKFGSDGSVWSNRNCAAPKRTKLTDEDVLNIRAEYDNNISPKDLANKYNVTCDNIYYIVKFKSRKNKKWKKLKPASLYYGHLYVTLNNGHKELVHRLILEAFDKPCPSNMECCHNDGNPKNNNISNLRWGTSKENTQDMIKHGNSLCKLTSKDVLEIRQKYSCGNINGRQLAKEYNVSPNTISNIINYKTWKYI